MHPILAIVGRPNVGKSRLFNRIVGYTRAIVADKPGITRDRHYAPADWCGREFIAVDTGGLELDPAADLERKISKQSIRAVEEADVIALVFDGQHPPTAADEEIVRLLRKISKPVIYVVNKIDGRGSHDRVNEYHVIGAHPIVAVSAEHGLGVDELLDHALKLFPKEEKHAEEKEKGVRIAVVGRPNVGKSTLINRLAGEERVVVHEFPGTTRDSIDVEIELEGRNYTFIDTAGVKRSFSVDERIEKFTALRSLRTIDRANVVLQLIDAKEGLTKQDLHLMGFVADAGKGLIVLVNKWDVMKTDWAEYEEKMRWKMGETRDVPAFQISAATGLNCLKIFKMTAEVLRALKKKISTSELNKIVEKALAEHHLPVYRGKQVKIYYSTQVGTNPPTFALFSNYPAAVPYGYRRYLIGRLKEAMGIKGVPVKIVCRKK